MKIVSIKKIGKRPVYDISVKDAEHYVLENGVVTHNTSVTLAANQIFIITKAQDKERVDGKDQLAGWQFTININKSRFVKEKSKFPFVVKFNGGIRKYSGLLDLALEAKHVFKPKNGWYQLIDDKTGECIGDPVKEIKTETEEFLGAVIKRESFKQFFRDKYQLKGFNSDEDEYIIDDDLLLTEND